MQKIIINVLERDLSLKYYQGFHELALTLFLVLQDPKLSALALQKLAKGDLSNFLRKDMTSTLLHLEDINVIVSEENGRLFDFMQDSCVGLMFALPWVITWFSHVLDDFRQLRRLYDFFLSSNNCDMPTYLSAAIVLQNSDLIMKQEAEQAVVHGFLNHGFNSLGNEGLQLDWFVLLQQSLDLAGQYPRKVLNEYEEFKENNVKMWMSGEKPKRVNRGGEANSYVYIAVGVGMLAVFAGYYWSNAKGSMRM